MRNSHHAQILRIRDELRRAGYCFVADLAPWLTTLALCKLIGEPIKLGEGSPVHQLTAKTTNASRNSYSGIYGLGRFPMHTDMAQWQVPPRFLMLRCVRGAPDVATLLRDSRPIVSKLGTSALHRALVRPRRPLRGKVQLLHLLESSQESDGLFRWDQTFLEPATAASKEIFAQVRIELDAEADVAIRLENAADTLVFENWRMIHARGPVTLTSTERTVDRVYLGTLQ